MRQATRIYQPGPYQTGDAFTLSESAAHHLTVLRKSIGDTLILFKGDNHEWEAQIENIQKKNVQVRIGKSQCLSRESPIRIHLAQGISKGDKLDWVVQKAVELGVQTFTPIHTLRSHAFKNDPKIIQKKQKHWADIAISAVEQCGRNQLPTIHPTCQLDDYLNTVSCAHRWILSPDTEKTFRDYPLSEKEIALLIGPEGGWDPQELTASQDAGFVPVSLGPRILRTETAPLVILSLLQTLAGDF